MKLENLTLKDLVSIMEKWGYKFNISFKVFKEKPPINNGHYGLYLRHVRSRKCLE